MQYSSINQLVIVWDRKIQFGRLSKVSVHKLVFDCRENKRGMNELPSYIYITYIQISSNKIWEKPWQHVIPAHIRERTSAQANIGSMYKRN